MTAENLVNADTTAFDRVRPRFHQSEEGLSLELERIFEQGRLEKSPRALDLAIQGTAFFALQSPSGEILYTRDGSLRRNLDGQLTGSTGLVVYGSPIIPDDVPDEAVLVDHDGTVSVEWSGREHAIGMIYLFRFQSPSGLEPAIGQYAFRPSQASGDALQVEPLQDGSTIVQHTLEASNVSFAEERVRERLLQRRLADLIEAGQ